MNMDTQLYGPFESKDLTDELCDRITNIFCNYWVGEYFEQGFTADRTKLTSSIQFFFTNDQVRFHLLRPLTDDVSQILLGFVITKTINDRITIHEFAVVRNDQMIKRFDKMIRILADIACTNKQSLHITLHRDNTVKINTFGRLGFKHKFSNDGYVDMIYCSKT